MNNSNPITKPIWEEISIIRGRQNTLRDDLPKEYVRFESLENLEESQKRIEKKLDKFMEDCRKGECSAGRLQAAKG